MNSYVGTCGKKAAVLTKTETSLEHVIKAVATVQISTALSHVSIGDSVALWYCSAYADEICNGFNHR